jgi:hypothetical protein
MTNRRAKIAAGATVVGLAALGGAALGTNPGIPSGTQVASTSGHSVVTGASGAATVASAQSTTTQPKRAPIVTRASGGGANFTEED